MWLRLYAQIVGAFLYLGMGLIVICAPLLVPFGLSEFDPASLAPPWKIVATTLLIGTSIGSALMFFGGLMWATFPRKWHSR